MYKRSSHNKYFFKIEYAFAFVLAYKFYHHLTVDNVKISVMKILTSNVSLVPLLI